jgi:hypothetical protein
VEEPGAIAAAESQSLVATMGPLPGVKGRELPGHAPMEMDALDPPSGGGEGDRPTSGVLHQ